MNRPRRNIFSVQRRDSDDEDGNEKEKRRKIEQNKAKPVSEEAVDSAAASSVAPSTVPNPTKAYFIFLDGGSARDGEVTKTLLLRKPISGWQTEISSLSLVAPFPEFPFLFHAIVPPLEERTAVHVACFCRKWFFARELEVAHPSIRQPCFVVDRDFNFFYHKNLVPQQNFLATGYIYCLLHVLQCDDMEWASFVGCCQGLALALLRV